MTHFYYDHTEKLFYPCQKILLVNEMFQTDKVILPKRHFLLSREPDPLLTYVMNVAVDCGVSINLSYLSDVERISALELCSVIGTGRERLFDNIVYTAAQIMRVPVVLFIMVDADRIWIKSAVGLRLLDLKPAAALARAIICDPNTPLPEDLWADPRFVAAPNTPQPRFGVALPFIGPNKQRIGALCAIDFNVRSVSERQIARFRQLTEQGSELLLLRAPGLDVNKYRGTLNV